MPEPIAVPALLRALTAALLLSACAGEAAIVAATPETLAATIAAAKPGDTVRIAAGNYPKLVIRKRSFVPPLIVEAAAGATVAGVVLVEVRGLTWRGGTIVAPGGRTGRGPEGIGLRARNVEFVNVEGTTLRDAVRGATFAESSDIRFTGNKLTGLRTDGVNFALSRRLLVEGNSCTDFTPNPATYNPDGSLLKDGDHPDCIQLWSRPAAPPTADVTIRNNTATGAMVGIFMGNHVRGGIDDGGFDRVTIENNVVRTSRPVAVSIQGGRGVRLTGNDVAGLPESRFKANIDTRRNSEMVLCGNKVPDVRQHPGTAAC